MIPKKVMKHFASKYQASPGEVTRVFTELEYFLSDAVCMKSRPTLEVDKAWHVFILHTQEYTKYCMKKFNRIIHHVPDDIDDFSDNDNNLSKCSKCSSNCYKQ